MPIGPGAQEFLIDIVFRNDIIVLAIKSGKSISKVMMPIALVEKFGC